MSGGQRLDDIPTQPIARDVFCDALRFDQDPPGPGFLKRIDLPAEVENTGIGVVGRYDPSEGDPNLCDNLYSALHQKTDQGYPVLMRHNLGESGNLDGGDPETLTFADRLHDGLGAEHQGRVDNRIPDGDINAMLGCGTDGPLKTGSRHEPCIVAADLQNVDPGGGGLDEIVHVLAKNVWAPNIGDARFPRFLSGDRKGDKRESMIGVIQHSLLVSSILRATTADRAHGRSARRGSAGQEAPTSPRAMRRRRCRERFR